MSEKTPSISLEKYHATAENIILELQKIIKRKKGYDKRR